jgi:hypothetical protein
MFVRIFWLYICFTLSLAENLTVLARIKQVILLLGLRGRAMH